MYINSIALQEIQNLSKDVIENNIDQNELASIKKNDTNPLFKVYRIAHTGFSTPTLVGNKKKPILQWFQNAVKKVHDKLKNGIRVFVSHVKGTNSHDGRTPIGRLVGKFTELKNDMFSSMGIIYIEPKFREVYNNLNLNVGSYEGNQLIRNADSWIVSPDDIGAVSAIALSNSEVDRPAFPEAIEEGELQMFSLQNFIDDELKKDEIDEGEKEKGELETIKEEKMELTISSVQEWIKEKGLKPIDVFNKEDFETSFSIEKALKMIHEQKVKPVNVFEKKEIIESVTPEEIIKFIKENKIEPSKVYTKEELKVDKIVDELKKDANHDAYHKAVRLEGELKELKKTLKEKESFVLKEIKSDKVKEEIFKERNFDEKQSKFVNHYFKKSFSPSGDESKLKEEINKFTDEKLEEWNILIENEIVSSETKKSENKFAENENDENVSKKQKTTTTNDDGDYDFNKTLAELTSDPE
jgi:hypothetical protein